METQKPNRAFVFGSRSIISSVLVVSIAGILNFLGARNEARFDLTSDQRHTLSDQTRKIIRELKDPVRAVLFAKPAQREPGKAVLEGYRSLNPAKFTIEYVDPDKQPARTRQAGVKRYGTLQLIAERTAAPGTATDGQVIGNRDIQVEELTEEKITNALLKILKDRTPEVCVLTGHGEKPFTAADGEGFEAMRRALNSQSYEFKEINLVSLGKLPETCSALAIWGPTRAFFPQEISLVGEYLKNGGRLVAGLDMTFEGADPSQELNTLLSSWGLQYGRALLIDPSIQAMQLDASVLIVNQFSREHPVSKDFSTGVALPFTRPISLLKEKPEALTITPILTTSAKAWAESNLKELTAGRVQFTPGQDTQGALHAGVLVEGKATGSTAKMASRLAIFGSASFANNTFSRMLNNSDLFLNAVAWVLEDETSISIRPREPKAGKIELTGRQGTFLFLLTAVIMPLLVAAGGIGFWAYRRKL
jgi:ABC-type uncharacterized transport system involved in gliding motility auxiliary subunit